MVFLDNSNFMSDFLSSFNINRCSWDIALQDIWFYIYFNDIDKNNKVFVFKNQQNNIIGGAFLVQIDASNKIWQVMSIFLDAEYRGLKFIENFYVKLVVNEKIKLINGDQLSPSTEKIWKNITKNYASKVSEYNRYDKTINDKFDLDKIKNDKHKKFYLCLESKKAMSEFEEFKNKIRNNDFLQKLYEDRNTPPICTIFIK